MTEPADQLASALQRYARRHNLPADTTFVLYSPDCMVSAKLADIAKREGSGPVAFDLIPIDEIWFTDAGLNFARVTKISQVG